MFQKSMELCAVLIFMVISAGATEKSQSPVKLSASEIAERNVVARGGLQRWRSVQTLTMTGKMEAGGNSRATLPMPGRKDNHFMPPPRPVEQVRLPFVMELKRPRKMRVELQFNGQTAIQVFDGVDGWKLRPFLNRRDIEPYTEDEMKWAATQAELDGPLVDYAAKKTAVELAGAEMVEGREAYKLRLTASNGKTTDVWIDSLTFLEAKIEGTPRRIDGKSRPVEIYCRDYRTVDGLQIPFLLETRLVDLQATGHSPLNSSSEKIIVESVHVNPKLSDAVFSKADLNVAAVKPTATVPR